MKLAPNIQKDVSNFTEQNPYRKDVSNSTDGFILGKSCKYSIFLKDDIKMTDGRNRSDESQDGKLYIWCRVSV